MKLVVKDNKYIIYLKNQINDKIISEKYLKQVIYKLKTRYNIELKGFYIVNIYVDKYYGSIVELESDDIDYYNYLNQIDMQINIKNTKFLYEIELEYLNKEIISKTKIYKLNDKLFLEIFDRTILNKIIEYSNIIYGNRVKEIFKYSKRVRL